MVYNGKLPIKMDDLGVSLFLETPISISDPIFTDRYIMTGSKFVHGLWDKHHFFSLGPSISSPFIQITFLQLYGVSIYIYIYKYIPIHEHGLFFEMCRVVYLNLTWMIWAWKKSRFSLQRFRTTKQRLFTFNFTNKEYIIYKRLKG